jgi:hypothetical protein
VLGERRDMWRTVKGEMRCKRLEGLGEGRVVGECRSGVRRGEKTQKVRSVGRTRRC